MTVVYVAGPLIAAPSLPEARAYYEKLADLVRTAGLDPIVPHLETDPERAAHLTPTQVWEADRAKIDRSDVVLAHVGLPSSGVGAELAYACAGGKQIIALHRPAESVSKLLLGMLRERGAREVVSDDEDLDRVLVPALAAAAAAMAARQSRS